MADPRGDARGDELGEGAEDVDGEEDGAGLAHRNVESPEQPEGEDGLHDESAAEGVDREERRELQHDAARLVQRRRACRRRGLQRRGELAVGERREGTERGIDEKSAAFRLSRGCRRERVRQSGRERAKGAGERTGEVVPGEERGPVGRRGRLGEHGLLGGKEEGHVPGRWVQRSHERHQEQRPEVRGEVERDAGQTHQDRGSEQHSAAREAMAEQADRQQQQRRPEEGSRGDGPDLQRREAETRQVACEQDAGDAVGESAGRARRDQARSIGRRGRREQAPHRATHATQEELLQPLRRALLKFILFPLVLRRRMP